MKTDDTTKPAFEHPADGWYQIEPAGNHPNAAAGVTQVIDDAASKAIVDNFNENASKPGFAGMLVGRDHFEENPDKPTEAYGWLQSLQGRPDGIWGKIRWTGIGQTAVDDGTYRYFSTVYDQPDMELVSKGPPKKVRPLALSGLTLCNKPNNSGGKPITNRRQVPTPGAPAAGTNPNAAELVDDLITQARRDGCEDVALATARVMVTHPKIWNRQTPERRKVLEDGLRRNRVKAGALFNRLAIDKQQQLGVSYSHALVLVKKDSPELFALMTGEFHSRR